MGGWGWQEGKAKFQVTCSGRGERSKGVVECDMVVVSPGSSRLAWQWMAALGHHLEPPVPSLFTLTISSPLINGLAGLSVQDAEVTLMSSTQKKKLKERGPLLVTHQGLSGPGVLRLSAFGARELQSFSKVSP